VTRPHVGTQLNVVVWLTKGLGLEMVREKFRKTSVMCCSSHVLCCSLQWFWPHFFFFFISCHRSHTEDSRAIL
jgi:hypothetical protein